MYSNKNSDIVRMHTYVENGDLVVVIQTLPIVLYDKHESNSKRQGSSWHMSETSTRVNDTFTSEIHFAQANRTFSPGRPSDRRTTA
jgi:hypothetical protein